MPLRSEEHTSELQSLAYLVCRLLLEKKKYAASNGRNKVTIVHKANIMKALTGLFLDTAREVGKHYESKVQMDDRIVDACAMQLVLNPWQFDVIVSTNLFGDILFFFNDTATTEIYTLSLHDALPIYFYRFGVITSHSIFYHEVMIESRVVGRLR